MEEDKVVLFLLGKTGHGKSSTGNAILGREAFPPSDGGSSETYEVSASWSRLENRIIKVVDGPGLQETRLERGMAAKKLALDMQKGVFQCPEGFHALLLVLRYGIRYTEEEWSTVIMLKSLFGESFVRDYCIVVFTHGDNFDTFNRSRRTPNRTFQEWCREQDGKLQELLQECSYRAVLFYNYHPEKFDSQLQELLYIVDNMKTRGVQYTSEIFAKAARTREQLIVKENAPELRDQIQRRVHLLMGGFERLRAHKELNDEVKKLMENLKHDAIELQTNIAIEDKKTGVLDSYRQTVVDILKTIDQFEKQLVDQHNQAKLDAALADANDKFAKQNDVLAKEVEEAKKRNLFGKIGDFLDKIFFESVEKAVNYIVEVAKNKFGQRGDCF